MIDWTHWHNEPYLIGGLILMAWAYALATGPLRHRIAPGTPFPRARAWCFYSSVLLFYLAVGSPLDQIGERFLFSAHMVQHQLLMYPSAVLWVVGLPSWLVDTLARRAHLERIGYVVTRPIIAGLIFVLTQSIWHAPALYDWALQNRFVHVLEHVTFFGSAVIYWWPLLNVSTVWPTVRYPVQMLYLLGVVIGMTPLAAFITFTDDILYPTYEFAPRLINTFSAADDQLMAGVLMKLGGMLVTFAAFAFVFFRWYQESERRPKLA
jgi:putative membrane protein